MKRAKFISLSMLISIAFEASAQSILHDYYNDNKDSMLNEAIMLIGMPDPVFKPCNTPAASKMKMKEMGYDQPNKSENYSFNARDGKKLVACKFAGRSEHTIILLHGVKSSAFMYNQTGGLLRDATKADVFVLDLRGHGKSEGTDGDVDYINQYADDVADVVKAIRKNKPQGKIILAGHSMGGGIALRYAMDKQNTPVDGYLLFAPLIGHDSPALRQNSTVSADSACPFMQIHIARIIGLTMLNELGNHANDSLPVLFFNLPENAPSRKYSYRANKSSAPDSYREGIRSVKVPMLVLIGSNDEAFDPAATQKAFSENSNGKFYIVDSANHNSIRHNTASYQYIRDWFSEITGEPIQTKMIDSDSAVSRKLSLNWEIAVGQSYFTNTAILKNELNTAYMPPSMNYYTSLRIPIIKNFNRFGVRVGVGPRVSSFGLNSTISESNNSLLLTPIPANSAIKTSYFQQVFVDFPLFLYYETKSNIKGRSVTVEWGGIFGIQAYNRWKTFEKTSTILTTNSREDLPQCRNFQFGNSVKLAFVKNRKNFSSSFFVQGVFYSTNTFKSTANLSSYSYEVKIGIQLTRSDF